MGHGVVDYLGTQLITIKSVQNAVFINRIGGYPLYALSAMCTSLHHVST